MKKKLLISALLTCMFNNYAAQEPYATQEPIDVGESLVSVNRTLRTRIIANIGIMEITVAYHKGSLTKAQALQETERVDDLQKKIAGFETEIKKAHRELEETNAIIARHTK
jgi:hypothetical protein